MTSITQFYAVTSQKGGVGKTVTAVSLAHHLALMGQNTLLIDFDPQGHSATALGMDPAPGVFSVFLAEHPLESWLQGTGRERLVILPSNQKTKVAGQMLYSQIMNGDTSKAQILTWLQVIGQRFNCVVFDTPASGLFQELALEIANGIIIPASCDYLGIDGIKNTVATIEKLGKGTTKRYILPTMYDGRTMEARLNLQLLHDSYDGLLCEPIPASVSVREAIAHGLTIFEYESKKETLGRVRRAYTALAETITRGRDDHLTEA